MATSYYFWETSKSGFAKREGKNGLLMHAPISAMFSFFFLPLFFFLSFFLSFSFFLSILVTLSFWLLSCRGLFFSLRYFPFWSLSPWVLSTLLQWVLLPSSMTTSPFYSELIRWDFSFLPLGLHQMFLICCRHSFRTTHQLIGCPATTTAHSTTTHFITKFSFVCSCCIPLPLGLNG